MDKRVGATDDIETTNLDSRNVEYLYSDNDGHVVMDLETYDQTTIPKEVFGDDILYLKPNTHSPPCFTRAKSFPTPCRPRSIWKSSIPLPSSKARLPPISSRRPSWKPA